MHSPWVVILGFWFVGLMFLINGIFALRNPFSWRRTWWTMRRGFEPQALERADDERMQAGRIRWFGVVFAAVGALLTVFILAVTVLFLLGKITMTDRLSRSSEPR